MPESIFSVLLRCLQDKHICEWIAVRTRLYLKEILKLSCTFEKIALQNALFSYTNVRGIIYYLIHHPGKYLKHMFINIFLGTLTRHSFIKQSTPFLKTFVMGCRRQNTQRARHTHRKH